MFPDAVSVCAPVVHSFCPVLFQFIMKPISGSFLNEAVYLPKATSNVVQHLNYIHDLGFQTCELSLIGLIRSP